MSFVTPDFEFDSSQNNGDQVVFYRSNSTVKEPRFALISRKRATYDTSAKTYSKPEYRVRLFVGDVDADGLPRPERIIADLTLGFPVWSDTADITEVIGDLAAMISSPEFQPMVESLQLPNCCSGAETP